MTFQRQVTVRINDVYNLVTNKTIHWLILKCNKRHQLHFINVSPNKLPFLDRQLFVRLPTSSAHEPLSYIICLDG
jgi:hypothetical protein